MNNKELTELRKEHRENIYIKIQSNYVNTIFLKPEDVGEHLEEYYGIGRTTSGNLIDFAQNKPKEELTITAVIMSEEKFNNLTEWEA